MRKDKNYERSYVGRCPKEGAPFLLLLFALKVQWAVNQGGSLELVFVSIFKFGKCFDKMHMLSAAHINGRGGFTTKFMVVTIIKVSVEFYFVDMRVPFHHWLSGDGGKSVVVAFFALDYGVGASTDFMNVFLFFAFHVWIFHRGSSFLGSLVYYMWGKEKCSGTVRSKMQVRDWKRRVKYAMILKNNAGME